MARLTGQIAGVDLWHGMRRNWAGLVPRRWTGGRRACWWEATHSILSDLYLWCAKNKRGSVINAPSLSVCIGCSALKFVELQPSFLGYALLCKPTFSFFREKTSGEKCNVLYVYKKSITRMNFALLLWKWDLTELKRKWKTISGHVWTLLKQTLIY